MELFTAEKRKKLISLLENKISLFNEINQLTSNCDKLDEELQARNNDNIIDPDLKLETLVRNYFTQ